MKVVMLPWLAYGHISPLVELAKKLSARNIHTYICSTPVNLSSITNKISENQSSFIHLIELHLPCSPELPPHRHTTNGLPLHLHPTLRAALKASRSDFSEILKTLEPDLVIHDGVVQWAARVAFSNNIPSASILTSSATMVSYFVHSLMKPAEVEFPFPAIRLHDFEQKMLDPIIESLKNGRERNPDDDEGAVCRIMLITTSRAIEGKYLDYLSELMTQKIVPVGPLVYAPRDKFAKIQGKKGHHCSDPRITDDENCELIEWLGEKDEYSTVFLSFGSEYFLKKEEIEEIAYGLEISNVNFIWVIRFPAGDCVQDETPTTIETALPGGFLERTGERGKVVEKWAPQAMILSHPSTGGFVSHCGWSSLMESIQFGVPVIAMPMHLDQPLNAKMVVELGVGVEVVRDERGKMKREEIGKVIQDVVVGKTGEGLRRKAGEIGENLRARCEEEMDGLVQEMKQLCGKGMETP